MRNSDEWNSAVPSENYWSLFMYFVFHIFCENGIVSFKKSLGIAINACRIQSEGDSTLNHHRSVHKVEGKITLPNAQWLGQSDVGWKKIIRKSTCSWLFWSTIYQEEHVVSHHRWSFKLSYIMIHAVLYKCMPQFRRVDSLSWE